ncbi:MAG: T9SS type A sorting domain-containing protein [Lentimicrobiaceae bacterium]|nr:T9SS type A sorting domain-containing protein [Lentimicrobiaceae bacterium]
MKKTLFLVLIFFSIGSIYCQEQISGLSGNPVIRESKKLLLHEKGKLTQDTLLLPFFEDFSGQDIFPSVDKWADDAVFINNDYPLYPVSIGAATLDAVDNDGNIYKNASIFPFRADQLTSLPIRLDSVFSPYPRALSPKDSVFLSFYYQPQGRGNAPETGDSLILEFLVPREFDTIFGTTDTTIVEKWNRIWSSEGMTVDAFKVKYGSYFHQVILPITDSNAYFYKDFRFRFVNYASISDNTLPGWQSNCDFWNVDYVYLNYGRNHADTTYKDITFVGRAPSMLKKYEAMPYQHYWSSYDKEMKDSLNIYISNLGNTNYNCTYQYNVARENGLSVSDYNGGSYVVKPFYEENYVTHQPFARPPVDFLFPIGTEDSIQFIIKHYLTNDTSLRHLENDTISFLQKFTNYFAYDDGTPEAGYGLTPAGARLAYRFQLSRPDTLRAVRIYFNSLYNESTPINFNLCVWADERNLPGELLYSKYVSTPDIKNHFATYYFNDSLLIFDDQHRTFYVGWQQTTDDNLNIGYDLYNNAGSNTFYNTGSEWLQSIYSGALMIRPVVGKELQTHGIDSPTFTEKVSLVVAPNPSSGRQISVILPAGFPEQNTLISIYSVYGNLVMQKIFTSKVFDVSGLSAGMYVLRAENTVTKQSYTGKMVLTD